MHGEIETLEQLLLRLGYDTNGSHREDRQLVFVGDLVRRGSDSPAVLEPVMGLVANGRPNSFSFITTSYSLAT
jgi:hypothetical protein